MVVGVYVFYDSIVVEVIMINVNIVYSFLVEWGLVMNL